MPYIGWGNPQEALDRNRRSTSGAVDSSSYPDVLPNKFFRMKFFKYSRNGTSGNDTTISPTATINLPIPSNLTDQYGANFTGVNLGLFGGLALDVGGATTNLIEALASGDMSRVGREMESMGSALGSLNQNAVSDILTLLATRFAGVAGSLIGEGQSFTTAAQLISGQIENPRTVAAFQGMNLRNHTFDWILAPRNESESSSIENIISQMRFYMHPDVGALSNYVLLYPDQVELQVVGVEQNTYFYKTSVLVDLKVDRTAAGVPAFFKETGAPLMYRLTARFIETETITRRDLDYVQGGANSPSSQYNGDRSL